MGSPLGDFIRGKRDALRPQDVGLPAGERRRVPGLRRSELAGLAGISVEYLVRIEQGRDRNPSVSVVTALADALRLTVTEREHLRHTSKLTVGTCIPLTHPRDDVRQGVLRVLASMEPGTAIVTNSLGDVLAHTTGFYALTAGLGLLDDERPNLAWFVFTDPRARAVLPDWDALADELAFDLWRTAEGPQTTEFRERILPAAGDELQRRRGNHVVPARGPLRWVDPEVGELRFERERLVLDTDSAQHLVVFLPADDGTERALTVIRRRVGAPLRLAT